MKNTMSKHHEAVIAVVKKKPGNLDSIKEELPKVSHVMVVKVIKDLMQEGVINLQDDGNYSFTGTGKKSTPQPKDVKKEETKTEVKAAPNAGKNKEDADLGPKRVPGQASRDNTKFSLLNGGDGKPQHGLAKSRLVLAVLQAYCQRNPKVSFAQLEKLFESKRIQVRYGCFNTLPIAKGFSKHGHHRFYIDNVVKVGPQKTPVVACNQWDLKGITEFIRVAKNLGMKIQATPTK